LPIVTPDDLGNLDRQFARVLSDACVSYFTHDPFGACLHSGPAHLPVEIPTALELGIRRYAFVIAR